MAPRITLTDYTFLKKKDREFFFQKPSYAIDYRQKTLEECEVMMAKVHNTSGHQKMVLLEDCFEDIISNMTQCKGLLALIKVLMNNKNEYSTVIRAMQYKTDERNYLRTKLQQMVAQLATPERIQELQDTINGLSERVDHLKKVRERLLGSIHKQELRFVSSICTLYDKHLEEAMKQKNPKLQKDIVLLGKWNFLKDWLGDRAHQDKVIGDLLKSATIHPSRYRMVIPEEEELVVNDFDSSDVKRLKVYVVEQKKAVRSHEQDINFMNKKKINLESQLRMFDQKIKDIQELIRTRDRRPSMLPRKPSVAY